MEFNATFIVAFVSFTIFTVIMNIILYSPITKIIEKRKKYIDSNYLDAQNNINKSNDIYKLRNEQLDKARIAAKETISEKTDKANLKKSEITQQAKTQAHQLLDEKRNYYNDVSNEAKLYLKDEIKSLAQKISDKFMSTEEKIEYVDDDIVKDILKG